MPFYRDISNFACFMFLISGNLSPYLLSVAPTGTAAQVQQWGEFRKSHAAFIMVPVHAEQGQVMLYIKQKNNIHLTLSSYCHWRRNSRFWRKEFIYLLCGKENPHSRFSDTSGHVHPVFSRHWSAPTRGLPLSWAPCQEQETSQLKSRLVCQHSTEFLDFGVMFQVRNHCFSSPAFPV